MSTILKSVACCFGVSLILAGCASSSHMTTKLTYPQTAKTNLVENLHGVAVSDPYRWLEDDNAATTKAWVEAQNKVTFGYLEKLPQRQQLKERLTELWNYERFGVPFKEGSRYFFTRNNGLQNHNVLYVADTLEGEARVLLDPNTFSKDGTVALSGYDISDDGGLIAYGVSSGGSDWQEWKVRDIATGKDLEDHLQWVKFSSASWTKDGKGFYYSRYDAPKEGEQLKGVNYYQKLYFHRLGTQQSEDRLVYERPDQKEWGFGGSVTEDNNYLLIHVWQGTSRKNRVFYQDLQRKDLKVFELLNEGDAAYHVVANVGPLFYVQTDLDAPRGRLVLIDITKPERSNWKEIIPQSSDTLRGLSFVNNQFVAQYLKDAHSVVKIYSREGQLVREVALPGIGTVGGFGGKRGDTETFYAFSGYTAPGTIYRYDLKTGKSTVYREPQVKFNPADFETKQVFYQSKDGTRVPMFITHKKGLKLDGKNPTYLYGYGGFNISLTPSFALTMIAWMEQGGVYAVPNLRGGGEYGEDWHQAGTKLQKQNVFNDFIAAAEWLIANKYTRPDKLAIVGGSNGGLLVGACMTQRPELYGVALPAVGVMDMLRFHKFTIGWAWQSDYGSPEKAEEFKALYAYSPYHNLKPGVKYPSTLVTTGDHDDRVVPAHSFKFAARLQEYHGGKNPVLIRIETRAGHGAGKPTAMLIEEAADKLAFAWEELNK